MQRAAVSTDRSFPSVTRWPVVSLTIEFLDKVRGCTTGTRLDVRVDGADVRVDKRSDDFRACVANVPGMWGCGPTWEAAILDLQRTWPNEFLRGQPIFGLLPKALA